MMDILAAHDHQPNSASRWKLVAHVTGDGEISEKREHVFTEWDPSATSDLEALRSVFDANDDGKLTVADSTFVDFKVMVTNADGTRSIVATRIATPAASMVTERSSAQVATRSYTARSSGVSRRMRPLVSGTLWFIPHRPTHLSPTLPH